MPDKSDILARVCEALERGNPSDASAVLLNEYPFIPLENVGRRYSALQCTRVFVRDRFIDRYTGSRLVFPGALRLISILLPNDFPFHRNGKSDACHFAFYELFPTIDHLVPVSRGGADVESNWVTTSMLRNAAKANFTIEELGWRLHPIHDSEWDGLLTWFGKQVSQGLPLNLRADPYLRRWSIAADAAMSGQNSN